MLCGLLMLIMDKIMLMTHIIIMRVYKSMHMEVWMSMRNVWWSRLLNNRVWLTTVYNMTAMCKNTQNHKKQRCHRYKVSHFSLQVVCSNRQQDGPDQRH